VLAADSAATLSMQLPPGVVIPGGAPMVGNVYDNANKIFNLVKGQPIGCITFGSGNIGSASIGTLIKDLRKELTDKPNPWNFDVGKVHHGGGRKDPGEIFGAGMRQIAGTCARSPRI